MARIRSIKPEFFTSLSVADLSPIERLAWVGLWTHVDDDGRCVDDARLVKAAIFPLDDDIDRAEVERILGSLDAHDRIARYVVDGRRYLEIIGWDDHQKIDRRRTSTIPPPPLVQGSTRARRGLDEASPAPVTEGDDSQERDLAPTQGGKGLTTPTAPGGDTITAGQSTFDEGSTRRRRGLDEGSLPDLGILGSGSRDLDLPICRADDDEGRPIVPSTASPPATDGPVETVFDAWRHSTGRTGCNLDPKRRKLITRALKTFPVDDLVDAVRGWRQSPHHRGENDQQTVYNDIELLLRDAAKIERFRDLERREPALQGSAPRPGHRNDATRAALAARRTGGTAITTTGRAQ